MSKEQGIESLSVRKESSMKEDHIKPVLVGVAGGSASGKTTLCNRIISELSFRNCLVISLDSFYKGGIPPEKIPSYNFDIPDSLDFDLCYEVLKKLLNKEETEIPVYNFTTHSREKEWEKVRPSDIILFEGILSLCDQRIVDLMSLKIFVQCDDDIRLYRRLLRDVKERGRDVGGILYQYNTFVKPSFNDFIGPSMKHANIIVPGNSDNTVAVNLVVDSLRSQVKTIEEIKTKLKKIPLDHQTMLNPAWLHYQTEETQASELIPLLKTQRIWIPTDETVRTETINIFNLFSKKFSKTLYKMCISRFITYDIKIMLRHNKENTKNISVLHYSMAIPSELEDGGDNHIVAIVVPILDHTNEKEVRAKIEALCEVNKSLNIFVFAMFAEMDSMVEITEKWSNVIIINNLCLLDLKSLLRILVENCRTKVFDFNKSPFITEELVAICKREIKKINEEKDQQ